jgi:hypothetical protein
LLAILPPRLLTAEGMSGLCCSSSSLYVCCLPLLLYLFTAHFPVCPVRLSFHTLTIFFWDALQKESQFSLS